MHDGVAEQYPKIGRDVQIRRGEEKANNGQR